LVEGVAGFEDAVVACELPAVLIATGGFNSDDFTDVEGLRGPEDAAAA
jgi:hypothetical protein